MASSDLGQGFHIPERSYYLRLDEGEVRMGLFLPFAQGWPCVGWGAWEPEARTHKARPGSDKIRD
jgi:hypothetical protein